jgi:hypothetical protein
MCRAFGFRSALTTLLSGLVLPALLLATLAGLVLPALLLATLAGLVLPGLADHLGPAGRLAAGSGYLGSDCSWTFSFVVDSIGDQPAQEPFRSLCHLTWDLRRAPWDRHRTNVLSP